MKLQLIANNEEGVSNDGPRILAAGAPPSVGPIPNELAMHLQHGEALVWWGLKNQISLAPAWFTLGGAAVILALVTGFAPELWTRGWADLWKPLGALLSPTAFVLLREWLGRRAIMVTDSAIIEVDRSGTPHRLPLGAIELVRRDVLRGGVRLSGRGGQEVFVPPALADDARQAVASQVRRRVRGAGRTQDSTGWMP